jgi:hypothetical protein
MKNSTKGAILAASLVAACATADAAATPAPTAEQMASCAAISGRDLRLSCYDTLARRPQDDTATTANIAPAAPTPATPAVQVSQPSTRTAQSPTTVPEVAADPKNFGLSAKQEHIADLGPKSEMAHISILSSDQTGKTYVVLDDGQTWMVTDPDGWLNSGDAVTIKRAQFGSYLMFVPSNHSYHVRRVK